MNNLLLYRQDVFKNYKSKSQIARVLSESWFSSQMYCPSCLNSRINTYPNNEKAKDFYCSNCNNDYQLKSSSKQFGREILDGEFNTMMKFIRSDKLPNFFLMNYSDQDWYIKNLFVIPKFFFTPAIIKKRKPLSDMARRRGWVGCNILLGNIPDGGRISIVKNEKIVDKEVVNQKWKNIFFLSMRKTDQRGWISDVLKCIEDLSKEKFSIKDIYESKSYFQKRHPENKHIEAKIRQQLQILRDNNIIKFNSRGNYTLTGKTC